MIVMKFGGTSVESHEAIKRLTDIVRRVEARRPIVVVSATGKTTNKLLCAGAESVRTMPNENGPSRDRTVVSVTEDDARPGGAVIEKLARERLGFEQLRPGQFRAVEALAGGRDVLAVLPTGGGKSAIYELAGMLREGPAVVVSPLIALQADQLESLREREGARPAAIVNSAQRQARLDEAWERLADGSLGQFRDQTARNVEVVAPAKIVLQALQPAGERGGAARRIDAGKQFRGIAQLFDGDAKLVSLSCVERA